MEKLKPKELPVAIEISQSIAGRLPEIELIDVADQTDVVMNRDGITTIACRHNTRLFRISFDHDVAEKIKEVNADFASYSI